MTSTLVMEYAQHPPEAWEAHPLLLVRAGANRPVSFMGVTWQSPNASIDVFTFSVKIGQGLLQDWQVLCINEFAHQVQHHDLLPLIRVACTACQTLTPPDCHDVVQVWFNRSNYALLTLQDTTRRSHPSIVDKNI